jgi:hypothetical protein
MAKVLVRGDLKFFACPACNVGHRFDGKWVFNGDVERPTVSPRLKTMHVEREKHTFCFSRIENGYIQFDPTSQHDLAGHSLLLPDWDAPAWAPHRDAILAR